MEITHCLPPTMLSNLLNWPLSKTNLRMEARAIAAATAVIAKTVASRRIRRVGAKVF